MHEQYQASGLVVLGLNYADEREIAVQLLSESGVTFPNILDPSEAAWKTTFEQYRSCAVPTQCLIDREGRVVDAWTGWDEARAQRALRSLGIG